MAAGTCVLNPKPDNGRADGRNLENRMPHAEASKLDQASKLLPDFDGVDIPEMATILYPELADKRDGAILSKLSGLTRFSSLNPQKAQQMRNFSLKKGASSSGNNNGERFDPELSGITFYYY